MTVSESRMSDTVKFVATFLSVAAAIAQLISGYITGQPMIKSLDKQNESVGMQSCCFALVEVVKNQSAVQCTANKH